MKSEHRHELKTNELAEWITNLPQWAKENLRMIIYVSVVVVAVAGSYSWHRYQKNVVSVQRQLELTGLINRLPQSKLQILQAQTKGVDISYMLIQTADNLQAAAADAKDDQMAAFALIKRAETLRMELHYRFGTVDEQDVIAQIDKAEASYAEAFTKASGNSSGSPNAKKGVWGSPSLMAAAKFGVGLCKEERGEFATAKSIYRYITENTLFEGTTAAAAAKQRLDTMADYQRKVVFKAPPIKSGAKPAPTESELVQPQIKLEVPDSNLPSQ